MIAEEYLNNGTLVRHYSDTGMKVVQVETGDVYDEAVDIVPCQFTYVESDEPVEEDEDVDLHDERILEILLGEET